MINTFGYAKHPSMPDNPTGFFEYPEDHPMQKKFNYYKEQNENMIEWAASLTDEDFESIQYKMGDKTKEVDLMDFKSSVKACKAIRHSTQMKFYGKSYSHCD